MHFCQNTAIGELTFERLSIQFGFGGKRLRGSLLICVQRLLANIEVSLVATKCNELL